MQAHNTTTTTTETTTETAEIAAAPLSGTAQGQITRRGAAMILGCSTSKVRSLEKKAILTPIVDAQGVHRFELEAVRTAAAKLTTTRRRTTTRTTTYPGDMVSGDLAAEVFTRFAAKRSPIDVVIEMRLHPTVVEGLFKQWHRMRGAAVLHGHHADHVREVLVRFGAKFPPFKIGETPPDPGVKIFAAILSLSDVVVSREDATCRACLSARHEKAARSTPARAALCVACAKKRFGGAE